MTDSTLERDIVTGAACDIAEALGRDGEAREDIDALKAVVASILGDDGESQSIEDAYWDSVAEYGYADDCPLDGDHDSAMTSIGWGTDEDYGYYGDDGDGW